MKINSLKIILIFSFLFLLSSCIKLGEDYQIPKSEIEGNSWKAVDDKSSEFFEEKQEFSKNWWQKFNDINLSSLVEKSLDYNHDIKIAESRITEAVANHNIAFASLLPEVNGTSSFQRNNRSSSSGGGLDRSSEVGIQANWDLDIFGSNQRKEESALADIDAAKARSDSIKLAIVSEVIRNYIRLRQAQKQQDLIIRNIRIQQETLEGTIEKRKLGVVTNLEVARAEAQVEETRIRLLRIDNDKKIITNRLHVLTGKTHDELSYLLLNDNEIPYIEDEIIISTPLQVVANHPDIKEAERNLASRTALSGSAFADMFPKLSLNGAFSAQESNLFSASTPWNLASNIVMPIINFGSLRSRVDAAEARQEQAYQQYRKTVLTILENTENSFNSYKNEKIRLEKLLSILEKRKSVAKIAKEQYKASVITQLDLLVAQQDQLNAENDFVSSEAELAVAAAELYSSFGSL